MTEKELFQENPEYISTLNEIFSIIITEINLYWYILSLTRGYLC